MAINTYLITLQDCKDQKQMGLVRGLRNIVPDHSQEPDVTWICKVKMHVAKMSARKFTSKSQSLVKLEVLLEKAIAPTFQHITKIHNKCPGHRDNK